MKKFLTLVACVAVSISAFSLNPSREYKFKPDKYGMVYKEEKVATKDGASLNAWFFEATKKTSNWIVISSGGDGNMSDNIELAGQFMSAGWNVAMYDYRGYGASSEFAVDPDTYIYPQFVTDLNSVLDYLRKSRAIVKFDLFGLNIGAGLSIGVGMTRPETRKIIADGPWTSLEQMKKKLKTTMNKDVILPFGYNKNQEPIYACDGSNKKVRGVMIILSAQDPMVNPSDMPVFKCSTNTFIVKTSATNAENFSTDKNAYFERVTKFLNQ